MGCTKSFTFGPAAATGNTFMDQAIYHSGTNKIYGVRGQWVFRCSPTTGEVESSLRIAANVGGIASIAAIGANLYIGVSWASEMDFNDVTAPFPFRDIYVIDTATFTTTSRFNFDVIAKLNAQFGALGFATRFIGWTSLATDGTKLVGRGGQDVETVFSVDPSNLATYNDSAPVSAMQDVAYDSTNNVFWFTEALGDIAVADVDFANDAFNSGALQRKISGITYCKSQNKVYFVRGDNFIGMINAADAVPAFTAFPYTMIDSGQPSANPVRIKSVDVTGNPFDGKVLIPTFGDDSVIVWDPATDTAESVKTGFTSPFDIVITDVKCFALQTGLVSLREIV